MKTLQIAVFAAASTLFATAGFAEEPNPHAVKLYNTYCVQCHGINRDGNGVNSPNMAVKPRDHTDTKAMGDTPDDVLFKAIQGGGLAVGKSVLMPRWGDVISDDEIKQLVAYLRYVSKTTSK